MKKQVVIATNNEHKLEEIARILAPCKWEFHTLKEFGSFPEPIEDADSFEGNARIKAKAALQNTHIAALADDSGLEVDALDGAPGVYSSRFAGENATDEQNNAKLLKELANIDDNKRTARFVSSIVFIDTDGTEITARGTCEGRIAHEEHGEHGFGYDPLFISDALGSKTTAEVSAEQKDAISHRGAALREFLAKVQAQD